MRGLVPTVLSVTLLASGCDFFKELESLPEAGEDESGESGIERAETDGGPCDVLDESCPDQDTLLHCDFESGEIQTIDCAAWCGSSNLLNFTCSPTAEFLHGCWCVESGSIKLDTCWQLEDCVIGCGGDPNDACTQDCFGRTDAQTIRLLGTLYSCADRACDDLCASSPVDCGSCLLAARAGLWGDCGVEREVCDADATSEPGWP